MPKYIVLVKVFAQTIFFFGLLGWVYGVAIQFTYMDLLPYPLSHLTLWLRLDTFTILCFILSAAGFFTWRLVKEVEGR
jgi:hypothetical protein